jgi:2-amino-4-hydroxy-6-hydroxymethyldihydropteridine diphosphokinase
LLLSTVYESAAVGFDGAPFYNLVAGFDTELSITQIVTRLRAIEQEHGRTRDGPKFSPRTLDIDLLTYGDRAVTEGGIELPRDEITYYSFVLGPLAELAGDEVHPLTGKSYRRLWQEFDHDSQPLWPVELLLDSSTAVDGDGLAADVGAVPGEE